MSSDSATASSRDWNAVVTVRDDFAHVRSVLGPFGRVDRTGLFNVLALRVDDPRVFLEQLQAQLDAEPELAEQIGHVAPATVSFCFATAEEFEDRAKAAALAWADQIAGRSFHVRMHRRGFKGELSGLHEEQLLDEVLLSAAKAHGAPARISFDDPDLVIAVETIRGWAGMALWTREQLERHPLLARAFHLDHREEPGNGWNKCRELEVLAIIAPHGSLAPQRDHPQPRQSRVHSRSHGLVELRGRHRHRRRADGQPAVGREPLRVRKPQRRGDHGLRRDHGRSLGPALAAQGEDALSAAEREFFAHHDELLEAVWTKLEADGMTNGKSYAAVNAAVWNLLFPSLGYGLLG